MKMSECLGMYSSVGEYKAYNDCISRICNRICYQLESSLIPLVESIYIYTVYDKDNRTFNLSYNNDDIDLDNVLKCDYVQLKEHVEMLNDALSLKSFADIEQILRKL